MSEPNSPNDNTIAEGFYDDFFSFIPDVEHAEPVPVVHADKLDERTFIKDWVEKNKPCLVKGAVNHWPAVNKWKSKEYWLNETDNFDVPVFMRNNLLNKGIQENGRDDMLFHDAIDRIFKNKDYVLSMPSEQITDDNGLAKVRKDLGRFNFLDPDLKPRVYWNRRVFIYRRAATSWHSHPYDETLMCQINGSKKVALIAPPKKNAKVINDFLTSEKYLNGETLDPSLEIKPFITMVDEGDALYIPPYWYHGVVPADGNIGFTLAHCWASPIHKLGDFSNFIVRNNYIRALWPIRRSTLKVPFIALYAGCSFLIRKIKSGIST